MLNIDSALDAFDLGVNEKIVTVSSTIEELGGDETMRLGIRLLLEAASQLTRETLGLFARADEFGYLFPVLILKREMDYMEEGAYQKFERDSIRDAKIDLLGIVLRNGVQSFIGEIDRANGGRFSMDDYTNAAVQVFSA